ERKNANRSIRRTPGAIALAARHDRYPFQKYGLFYLEIPCRCILAEETRGAKLLLLSIRNRSYLFLCDKVHSGGKRCRLEEEKEWKHISFYKNKGITLVEECRYFGGHGSRQIEIAENNFQLGRPINKWSDRKRNLSKRRKLKCHPCQSLV